ncbi:EboA domain-containing protein [Pollutibacter soli]|uniref:EboA domain-containing protein n=1 Tax=Pollutibacter soli TaxID=3034157 RepID=UPI00301373FE
MEHLLAEILKSQVSPDAWTWLEDQAQQIRTEPGAAKLNHCFVLIPRKTGKKPITPTSAQLVELEKNLPGAGLQDWTADRLARVWILTQIDTSSSDTYVRKIEQLFLTAEMNELVALYSALPYLKFPERWVLRCSEGIRNNIATVLEAVMYENPYPAQWLSESAWNQLVMKAFFTDKNVDRITGLDKRANQHLADILTDYAHERWQAHRKVNPQLWRLVSRFINNNNFSDLRKVYSEGDHVEKKAAILACSQSEFAPAKQLVAEAAGTTNILETLSWKSLINESL